MGHILGIGTMWGYDHLLSGSQYVGSHALLAYQLLSGNPSATSVPLETGGGPGTAGAHWSEAAFGNELMTGFISGIPDPLSSVTIGSLQDMGYTVNYSAADPYALPGSHVAAGPDGASAYADPAQAAPGGSGTVGTSAIALFVDDQDQHGHDQADPPAANLALMTNYMASTFVPPAGESAVVAPAQPSDQPLLAHPVS